MATIWAGLGDASQGELRAEWSAIRGGVGNIEAGRAKARRYILRM